MIPEALLPTIYEDEHLQAVEIPAALPVRSAYVEEPAGVLDVFERFGDRKLHEGARLGPGFSGVLLLGRTPEAARAIKTAHGKGLLKLTFEGLCSGRVTQPEATRGRGGRVLVHYSAEGLSLKAVRAQLKRQGVRELLGPWGLRLTRVQGPHPVTGEPIDISQISDGGMRAALEEGWDAPALVQMAAAVRAGTLLDPETDCCRILNGAADGLPGLVADRFGDAILLYVREGAFKGTEAQIEAVAEALSALIGGVSVFLRRVARAGGASKVEREPLVGEPREATFWVRENGLSYLIEPHHGLSPGLFLDQRHNRLRVQQRSGGRRVLNTFAHTCGFSVAAAAGGASEVVSVDALKHYLSWGKDNMRGNGIDADAHVFVASDVVAYMERAARKRRRFDLIILDPPSFGRGGKGGRTFSIGRDLDKLVAASVEILSEGGEIVLCTNNLGTDLKALRRAVSRGAGGRAYVETMAPKLPPGYAGDAGFAKTLWVRF